MLCTPSYPMVLLIIIPFLNGYFIGEYSQHFQTNPCFDMFWCRNHQLLMKSGENSPSMMVDQSLGIHCLWVFQGIERLSVPMHSWDSWDVPGNICYPLVNIQKIWKITMLSMGKSTINGPYSIAMLVYQRLFHSFDPSPLKGIACTTSCNQVRIKLIYIYTSSTIIKSPLNPWNHH